MQPAARAGAVKFQLATETLRLHADDWVHCHRYRDERGMNALPASPELAATFLAVPGTGRAVLAWR